MACILTCGRVGAIPGSSLGASAHQPEIAFRGVFTAFHSPQRYIKISVALTSHEEGPMDFPMFLGKHVSLLPPHVVRHATFANPFVTAKICPVPSDVLSEIRRTDKFNGLEPRCSHGNALAPPKMV